MDISGSARLLESNGKRGHYTALSYCWGSAQKSDRPYLTTTKTLEKHLSEIPLDILPKTLRDAVLLTRAVGIRYLWIDSLCIIQDSNDDWEKEAATMGTVYARARLVIAATIGRDADAGLFPFQTKIYRPGQPSMHFCKMPDVRGSLGLSLLPLFTRGWATQEWMLARRIVFWSEERMFWYCAQRQVVDDDIDCRHMLTRHNLEVPRNISSRYRQNWEKMVMAYSSRDLTYPTDKLVALRGIVNELQKRSPADKYAFGLWQSNLARELLWSGQAAAPDPRLKELHIPSWSWAGHPGGVRYMQGWEPAAQLSLSLLEEHTLQIVARSKVVDFQAPDTENGYFRWVRKDNYIQSDQSKISIAPYHMLGICPPENGAGSLQVVQQKLQIFAVFDIVDFLSTYHEEQDNLGVSTGTPDEFFVEIAEVKSHSLPYNVGLILRRSSHTPDRYIRVGLGFAFRTWLEDAELREFIVE